MRLFVILACVLLAHGLRQGLPVGRLFKSSLQAGAALQSTPPVPHPMKVAYQGEPGAYSEKASRELLGSRISTVPYQSFEDTFRAVASREVDYAVVPIENSLGGSIHTNFDLLLRYDLHIIAEHEFRVEHFLLALPGVKKEDIKKVMSHPQALAQCDNYIRNMGATPTPAYDTAGSAKMIAEGGLRDCAAVASDLAGKTYGLDVLEGNIEDHDNNWTRFLLLARNPVSSIIPPSMAAKTSIVFVVPNMAGALYKALACFSLRDIDFCKIESRPTPVDLLQRLKFQSSQQGYSTSKSAMSDQELPRFLYTFYLDFLASEFDDRTQNALLHLREQSDFVRVLGSYPKGSELIGPVKAALNALANIPVTTEYPEVVLGSKKTKNQPLKIGIIGFGNFGQFIAKTFVKNHQVYCVAQSDKSSEAKALGCEFYPLFDLTSFAKLDLDVILISVSIISFESVLRSLPKDLLAGKLIVDVLSVKAHPKEVMLEVLPESSDILCTHPMFGPESGKSGWQGLPFLYDKIRVSNFDRCERFLSIWEKERCKMIDMSCEQHDEYAANSQFITHLTGRILWQQNLKPTPIDTKGFQTVLNLVENTCSDSFDLFFGLYFYNSYASDQLQKIREALAKVERQLAAKEAYLAARAEANTDQRNRILEECRSIMREALQEYKPLPPSTPTPTLTPTSATPSTDSSSESEA
ncbi:hypothetical protein B484DRAFT_329455 [Ochromonadaceae sp. CCMP2298]|nr:hypothetical protein B484DRAFT_329455 [Ochromonadaceae sp. CCMP2298]